jgi:hypothetical protein
MPALPQRPHHPAYGSASGGVFAKDNILKKMIDKSKKPM